MKLILTIFAMLCAGLATFSQITTTLTVNQPSATLNDWTNNNTTIIYVVDKAPITGPQQVIIKAELRTVDGTVVAVKDLTKAPVYTLTGGTRIFYAKDVMPIETMAFSGTYKSTYETTGQLSAAIYQLNVQLVEPGTFGPLTPVLSRIFNLAAPQLPYLVLPLNNDSLNIKAAETAIIFRWTPLIPRIQPEPYYRLQVFEILPYQQPMQALRGNQPLLDHLVKGQTQYIWHPRLPFSTDTSSQKFIWTIQTLDGNQQPVIRTNGNSESRSEPFVFYLR